MDACSCDGTRLAETFAVLTCAPRDASQTLLLVVCLLSAFTYASAGLLVQIGSADGSLPVGEFTLARGLLQTAAAGLLLRGEREYFPREKQQLWAWLRGTITAANIMLYFTALTQLPLGDAVVLTSLYPITGPFFSRVFLGERLPVIFPVALLLALAGATTLTQPTFIFGTTDAADSITTLGYTCALSASLTFGLQYPVGRMTRGTPLGNVMFAAGAMTMLAALVLSFALPEWRIVDPLNATVWACLVGQAVLLVFAQFGFILTTQELPAHVGSVLQITDIFWAYVYQCTVRDEPPTWEQALGAGLIVCAVLVAIYGNWKESGEDSEEPSRPLLSGARRRPDEA